MTDLIHRHILYSNLNIKWAVCFNYFYKRVQKFAFLHFIKFSYDTNQQEVLIQGFFLNKKFFPIKGQQNVRGKRIEMRLLNSGVIIKLLLVACVCLGLILVFPHPLICGICMAILNSLMSFMNFPALWKLNMYCFRSYKNGILILH